jgi:hypothetical protein
MQFHLRTIAEHLGPTGSTDFLILGSIGAGAIVLAMIAVAIALGRSKQVAAAAGKKG